MGYNPNPKMDVDSVNVNQDNKQEDLQSGSPTRMDVGQDQVPTMGPGPKDATSTKLLVTSKKTNVEQLKGPTFLEKNNRVKGQPSPSPSHINKLPSLFAKPSHH